MAPTSMVQEVGSLMDKGVFLLGTSYSLAQTLLL